MYLCIPGGDHKFQAFKYIFPTMIPVPLLSVTVVTFARRIAEGVDGGRSLRRRRRRRISSSRKLTAARFDAVTARGVGRYVAGGGGKE